MSDYNGPLIYRSRPGNRTITYPTVCLQYEKEMFTKGLFFGDNPLDFIYPVFMIQVILAFCVSKIIYFVLRPLRQQMCICNVLAGIILGPSVLGRHKLFMEKIFPVKEMLVFNTLATIGTAYFIFITAVKTDTEMLLKTARNAWIIGLSSYMVTMIVILLLGFTIFSHLSAPFGGASLAILAGSVSTTYFSVIARAMEEHDLLTSELGQLAMSSSMLNEAVGWAILSLSMVFGQGNSWQAVQFLFYISFIFIFAIHVIRPLILYAIKRTPDGRPINQAWIISLLIAALVMALCTDFVAGTFLPGALLMGFIIPDGPPLGAALIEKSELIIMEFFLPLFFVQIGYLTDLSKIKNTNVISSLVLIVVGYLTKIMGTLLASLFINIRLRNALLLSLIMNFKGVLDFLAHQRWLRRKLFDEATFASLVVIDIVITATSSILVDAFYKPQIRLEMPSTVTQYKRTLQSTPEGQELRVLACIHSEDNVHSIIGLLEASNPNAIGPIFVYMVHLIELVGRSAPIIVPYNKHRGRLTQKKTDQIVRAFQNYSKNSRGPVTVQPFTAIAPYKSMDNIVYNFAQDKNISLILVPFDGNQPSQPKQTHLRNFNINLQERTTSTIGILVDRGSQSKKSVSHFFYNVAVLFLGGPDDREAMALAIRMSRNPNVSITLVNIGFQADITSETERNVNQMWVRRFKEKNASNACVVCQEVVVNDSLHLVDVIRSLDNSYDLIMVGRRHQNERIGEEMAEWVEHPELGIIGDMLASSGPRGVTMSILVLQHCSSTIS